MKATGAWMDDLAAIVSPRDRADYLNARPELIDPQRVEELHAEVLSRVLSHGREAANLAAACAAIARRVRNPGSRALGSRALAHVSYMSARYERARRYYERAARGFDRIGNEHELARTLSSGLQTLIYLGEYDLAVRWAARAREIFERLGDALRVARLDSNLGNLYYRQDRYEQALKLYRGAHDQFRRCGQPSDIAAVLSNTAVCHISLHQFDAALELYLEARTLCDEHGMPVLAAEADYNIAYLHFIRGEYMTAIDLYRSAREYCRKAGDSYHAALCDLDQAELALELNLVQEGAQMAESAHRAFEVLGMGYEQAKALAFLAVAEHGRQAPNRALRLFGRARTLFRKEGNPIWPALIDIYRALVLFEMGRPEPARKCAEKALRFFSGTRLVNRIATCEMLLSRYHLSTGGLPEARSHARSALSSLGRAEFPIIRFQAEFLLGEIEERAGRKKPAMDAYLRARQWLETLRSQLFGEDLKISFLSRRLLVYESLVRLTCSDPLSGPRARSVFQWIEQAKSRALADHLAHDPTNQPHRDLMAPLLRLRQELNTCYRRIETAWSSAGPGAGDRIQDLWRRARACERDLQSRISVLGIGAPSRDVPVADLEQVQATLPSDAAILEYFEAGGKILAAVVQGRSVRVTPVADAREVERHLQLLRYQFAKFRLQPEYLQTFADIHRAATDAHLRYLYAALIAPVRRHLKASHLVIVPHGALHTLPFHALLRDGRPLIDDFTISYAPSSAVFSLCARRRPAHDGTSLVLGIPDESTPLIEAEARAAAQALPGSVLLLGSHANGDALSRLGRHSRFIHIATHGTFRRDNPMFSSLRLGTYYLTALDFRQFEFSAELVTLSGCSTGLNLVVVGDELLGLVRGILGAGASSMLVSLWDVNDRSTADFMVAFYRHLRSSPTKAVALQRAINTIRNAHSHPYYWAPFVLVGNYGV